MVTPKEFRLGAIPELIGMALFFLYYKYDLPYVVRSFSNIYGELQTDVLSIQDNFFAMPSEIEWFKWILLMVFVIFVVGTCVKGFIQDKPIIPLFHSYSVSFSAIVSFFLIVCPFIMWISNSFMASSRPFPYNVHYIFLPHIYAVLLGIYLAIVGYYSLKRLFRCYDKYPKQVARMTRPFFSKSWLERHYGKSAESETECQKENIVVQPITQKNVAKSNITPRKSVAKSKNTMPAFFKSKNFWIGFGGVVVLLLVILFFLTGRKENVKSVNIPAVREAIYKGTIGTAKVQMALTQSGDTITGEYFYEKHKQPIELRGVATDAGWLIQEYMDGKNTGTFDIFPAEYDGEPFLAGMWKNGSKSLNVNLSEIVSHILPSPDVNHPFVGEWETADGAKAWARVQLGLYNKDIEGEYASIAMPADGVGYQLSVDSILKLDGQDAVLLIGYGTEQQNFTLHYFPSDQSLRIETEKWGTYQLFMDHRTLEERLEALEETLQVDNESGFVSEPLAIDTIPSVEAVPEQLFIYEDVSEEVVSENDSKGDEVETQVETQESAEDENKVYDKTEVAPEYPGGTSALMSFISKNLKYPTISLENNVQGKVVVQFIVEKDGTISNASIKKSVDPFIDKEALRVINAMPRWKPGIQQGKAVRVRFAIPINFRL